MKQDKEYKIEDLILIIRSFLILIKKHAIFISIISVITISITIFFRSETYVAQSSLFLKSSKSSRIFSLAASFGLGAETEVNYDKIKSVIESDYIIKKALYTNVSIKNKNDILINHLINYNKFREKWSKKNPELAKINMELQGYIQDSLCLNFITIIKQSTKISENKEKLIEIETSYKDQSFAIEINRTLTKLTLDFFKDIEINDELKTKEYLKNRLDSIRNRLLIKENEYASTSDKSLGIIKTQGLIDTKRIERDLRILNELYIELIKQLEMINFKILDKKSSIQLLNSPNYPLKPQKRSLILSIILGGLLGFFLSTSIVIVRIRYKKALFNIKK